MKAKTKTLALILCLGIGVTGIISGCQNKDDGEQTTAKTEEVKEETVAFTSKDGAVAIDLPSASWKVEEDTENLCTFSSDSGILMLTQSDGDGEVTIPKSEEDIKKILQKEGYNSENYEVLEYDDSQIANMTSYRSVIKYDDKDSPYIYGILYGTVIDNKEYMASAMLYSDSETLLEQVKASVYSFQVLEDKKLVEPEEATTVTPEATPEPTAEATPEPTPQATPEPTPQATPEPTPQPAEPTSAPVQEIVTPLQGTRACISPAYVRSGPNNQSPVVGTVVEGDTITVTGEIRNWYEINYGGSVAYVCKDYIG